MPSIEIRTEIPGPRSRAWIERKERAVHETPFVLARGDVLIAYTDGFDESRSMSAEGQLFGEDGVRESLKKATATGAGAKDIVQSIVRDVLEFSGGKRYDDMALVVVRRTQ